jgi:hypothetical protein
MTPTNDNESGSSNASVHGDSMAYLAALNAANLLLLDAVTFQRNNSMVYTAGLALAMKRIADGDEHGMQLLEAIQRSIAFDQDYLIKSGKSCAEILTEFKKLS